MPPHLRFGFAIQFQAQVGELMPNTYVPRVAQRIVMKLGVRLAAFKVRHDLNDDLRHFAEDPGKI